MPISRRTALAGGAGVAAGLAVPGIAAAGSTSVRFTLGAETLDGGEQITSLTLDTSRLGTISPGSVTTSTFTVHATATSPLPLAPGDQIFSEYDLDRTVTAARVDRRGNIVLSLDHAEGQIGGGTLGYIASKGRNVRLDLVYTITQNAPVSVRGRPVTISRFVQGRLVNREVDAFSYHESASGMKYRFFSAFDTSKRPLVVWLHGGGEGASLPDGYYDNETTLRANRGALGFATREAQRIFGGAHVVVPQSFSYWMEDGDRFAPLIREIVREVVRKHPVDTDRIHVVGCSNGGYMSMKMTVEYPSLFASSVPICGIVTNLISDAELTAIRTPSWLVTSLDDTTVPPEPNTIHASEVIPGARVTLYDEVTWNGHRFPGHWSWIYVARNDRGYWQWMARQRR
ncbi:putative esterase [Actinoplanes lutulentus]|uniref:Prolyl oligopeptidase family protein n=1 Tax=Actinoplanes lutulentus TaxID=1287878 RepID=A0A327Z1S5_9ACTN|nr:PHB depolymerase family esterase [Actinoplanes lutulentus]MBB2947668.1 putative esterase [Actinoplanes lutulentus]RAK27724.1 prolyl oligopeptidase family protein [Actinoplanes lutulentus]